MIFPQDPQKYQGGPSDRLGAWDQMPPAASTFAEDVDGLFYFVHWVSAFFFVLLTAILIYSVIKWRRKTEDQVAVSNVTHNTGLEVTWTVIPLIIVMVIFVWGWKSARDMTIAPRDAATYKVVGKKWAWSITQPGDLESDSLTNEIWLQKGVPAKLVMSSMDVLHSFYIPAFRAKRDVVPGRYQTMWFLPTKLGRYDLFCTEFCGAGHSAMIGWGNVHVIDPDDFAKKPWAKEDPDPIKRGQKIYNNQCKTCHNLDTTKLVGPGWGGIWGRKWEAEDGSSGTVDEAYVTESVRYPNKKLVKGYPAGGMTQFDETALKESRLKDVIEFMKTLK